jgi:hypothetical protein
MGGHDQRFPRWAGPIIGAGVGALLAFQAMPRGPRVNWIYLAVGGVSGALGGVLLWLLDAPPPAGRRPASTLGTVLAALALFPGCLPGAGLVIGVPAFLVNRRVLGWQNAASRLGLGLAVVMTAIVVVASLMPR